MIPRIRHSRDCHIFASREYPLDCNCGAWAASSSDTWAPTSLAVCVHNDMQAAKNARAVVKLRAFVASWPMFGRAA